MEKLHKSIVEKLFINPDQTKYIELTSDTKIIGYKHYALVLRSSNAHAVEFELVPASFNETMVIKLYPMMNDLEKQIFELNAKISDDWFQFTHDTSRIFIIDKTPVQNHYKVSFVCKRTGEEWSKEMSNSEVVEQIASYISESNFGRDS